MLHQIQHTLKNNAWMTLAGVGKTYEHFYYTGKCYPYLKFVNFAQSLWAQFSYKDEETMILIHAKSIKLQNCRKNQLRTLILC